MDRVVKTSLLTGLACVVLLSTVAAVGGYLYGAGANHQHPPGFEGAVTNAFIATVFLGPTVGLIGAGAGLGAGLVGETIDRLRGKR